jgi:transcriptional regulator with XRE-family HTH domain
MLPAQCQVARAILKLSVAELAKRARVSEAAIVGIEDGTLLDGKAISKAQKALEAAGVEFTFGDRPGVKIRTLDGIIEVSAGPHAKPETH